MLLERRVLIAGTAVIMFGGVCGCGKAHARDAEDDSGCWLPKGAGDDILKRASPPRVFSQGSEPMESRSGNPILDRALARGLATISKTFDVLPGFAYYREAGRGNAKAMSDVLLDRTDGTVLFGLKMLEDLLGRSYPDARILAVCAHEFGHILSYKNGMINELAKTGVYRAEQFADYMAGYFSGTRRLINPKYPSVIFASTQSAFGGGDHGSGYKRGEAVQAGFLAAYQQKLGAVDAANAGFDFSMSRSL